MFPSLLARVAKGTGRRGRFGRERNLHWIEGLNGTLLWSYTILNNSHNRSAYSCQIVTILLLIHQQHNFQSGHFLGGLQNSLSI